MIPAVVHRIWIGAPPPRDYVENAGSWLRCGMEVREWGESDVLALGLENQDLWDLAPKIQPSRLVPRLRSDIARYEILWRFGGVYADHDFRCIKPFPPEIAGLHCFAVEEKAGLIANGLMGCVPGHPFMRLLVDELPNSVRKQPRQQTWRMAGPGFVTRMADGRGDLTVLPQRRFLPYHHTDLSGSVSVPDDAVLEHTWGSARGQVSVIIPWRAEGPERARALQAVLNRYAAHQEWQVVVAEHDGGEFNKAAAVNDGVRRSCGDVLVICDADLLCPGVEEAVEMCRKGTKWVMPYTTLHRLTQEATQRVLSGADPKGQPTDLAPYPGVVGGGVVVLQRRFYEAVPMDERFVGWGGEDIAWGHALRTLAGAPRSVAGPLYHLWHPSEHIGANRGSDANFALYQRYAKALRNPNLMRRLVREAKAVVGKVPA